MASYILIGSASVVQVLSPKVTQDTVVATIQTVPSGIIVAMPVPQESFDAGDAGPILSTLADGIEAIIGQGKAIGGSGTSALAPSGLTEYFVTFEVGYNPPGAPSGTVTADVNVPVGLLAEGVSVGGYSSLAAAEAIIDKAYQNLVSLSGTPESSAAPASASSSASSATAQNG